MIFKADIFEVSPEVELPKITTMIAKLVVIQIVFNLQMLILQTEQQNSSIKY